MRFLLKFSTNIVVAICTEWLTLQDFAVLECCSVKISSVMIRLSEMYPSRFQLLLTDDMVVPITARRVNWFDQHLSESNVLHQFTENTLSLVKKELTATYPIPSWLFAWMAKSSSLVTCLKGIKRMEISAVNSKNLNENEVLFLRKSFEKLEELHVRHLGNSCQFFLNNLPCISRLVHLWMSPAPKSICTMLRQAVSLQRLQIELLVGLVRTVSCMMIHCRNLTSINIRPYRREMRVRTIRPFLFIAFHCPKPFTNIECPLGIPLLLRALLINRGGPQLTTITSTPYQNGHYPGYLDDIAALAPQLTSLTPFGLCLTPTLLTLIQSRFTQLKVLDLQHCSYSYKEEEEEGKSDTIQLLFTDCPQVSEINLMSHTIKDITFTSLLKNRRQPMNTRRIKHISLIQCIQLTDATLLCLAQLCPLLTSLTLDRFNYFSDSGLLPLLQNVTLRRLHISSDCLTVITINRIAEYCYDLRELVISDIKQSGSALLEVVRCCHRLKDFGCDIEVSEREWHDLTAEVKTINPRLNFFVSNMHQ